jgi:hypothetical protein
LNIYAQGGVTIQANCDDFISLQFSIQQWSMDLQVSMLNTIAV